MIRDKAALGLLLIISIFCGMEAAGADGKSFSISRGMSWHNGDPCIAVNTRTGDAVVAWFRYNPGSHEDEDGRILAVWCRYKKKQGKISVKAPREIGLTDSMSSDLDIAYYPDDNSYVVSWTPWVHSAIFGNPLPDVVARKINAKARPAGPRVDVAASGNLEMTPKLTWTGLDAASPGAARAGAYLLVFNYSPAATISEMLPGDREAGIYGVFLEPDGEPLSTSPFLIKLAEKEIDGHYAGRIWQTDLERATDSSYYLTSSRVSFTGVREAYLSRLRANGRLALDQALGTDSNFISGSVQLGPDLFLAYWDQQRASGAYLSFVCQFDSRLALGAATVPLSGKTTWPIMVVKLDHAAGAILLVGDGKFLYAAGLSADGVISAARRKLFKFNGKLVDMDAVCMPGTDRIFIAWTKKNGLSAEVRGYTFDASTLP